MEEKTNFLNINREIKCICAGKLLPNSDREVLCVGSPTSLLVFDVHENVDLFFQEVSDGVFDLLVGTVPGIDCSMVIVGSACSVFGFDHTGKEVYWTITGDLVSVLSWCDVDEDGEKELLVGSQDFAIRTFQHEQLVNEVHESGKIAFLKPLHHLTFSFGLEDGSLGVYEGTERRWKISGSQLGSGVRLSALESFDLDGDGKPEVLSGWSDGTLNVREEGGGEVLFEDRLPSPIVGIVRGDLRGNGREEVVVVGKHGEVRGYWVIDREEGKRMSNFSSNPNSNHQTSSSSTSSSDNHEVSGAPKTISSSLRRGNEDANEREIEELGRRKKELAQELKMLEDEKNTTISAPPIPIPEDVHVELKFLKPHPMLEISLFSPRFSYISIFQVVISEVNRGLLGTHSIVVTPSNKGQRSTFSNDSFHSSSREGDDPPCSIQIPLPLHTSSSHPAPSSLELSLHLSISSQDIVVELPVSFPLPSFPSFFSVSPRRGGDITIPDGLIQCRLEEDSLANVSNWISSNFSFSNHPLSSDTNSLQALLTSPDDQVIAFKAQESGDGGVDVEMRIDSLPLASHIMTSLFSSSSSSHVRASSSFPSVWAQLESILGIVSSLGSTTTRLSADMGETAQVLKGEVIRAEDGRIRLDMEEMRGKYRESMALTRSLISHLQMRENNRNSLVSSLKQLNSIMQQMSQLRNGRERKSLIQSARKAIQQKKFDLLFDIFEHGGQE